MTKVAWIGLGRMGTPMANNLVKAGYDITVWNRTSSKCKGVEGAKVASTPAEAAKGAEFIFTMVADDTAMCDCILGENGVVSGLSGGEIVIDMSTVSIEASERCNKAIVEKGATFLCAPVSGSVVIAESGKLTVMCSGPKESFDKAAPLFEKLSKEQFYLGEGCGARAMKLALNMMIATSTEMLAEALALCRKAGIEPGAAMDVISSSVLNSPFVGYKLPIIRNRSFKVSFPVRMMAKDLRLALEVIDKLRMVAPTTALVKQMLDSLDAQGYGDKDQTWLVVQMEKMAGLDPEELK
jgi:glyoxylate/succinic semialdehyde reductase